MLGTEYHEPDIERNHALLEGALRQNELVSQLDAAVSAQLRKVLALVWVESGETVLRQGEPSNSLALVVLGRVRVVQQRDDEEAAVTLLELGPGQTVGEMGLITGEPRSAGVVAVRDTLLALLSLDDYQKLVQAYPLEMNQQFVRPIIGRLQAQLAGTKQINASVLTMAVLPASPEIPLKAVMAKLLPEMQKVAKTVYLDAQVIAENFGQIADEEPTAAQALTRWLGEQEVDQQVVVYVADGKESAWTRRCLRQADKLVIMGEGTQPPPHSAEEVVGLTRPEAAGLDRYLVLLQPSGIEMPSGTAAWLEKLEIQHHYHLRLDNPTDCGRVGRLLAERGVGIVLGGASARGFAFVGGVQALREANIPIDVIGGVSSGAVSTVGLATEWDTEKIVQRAGTGPKLQYTIPFSALTTGYGNAAWMDKFFGNLQVEDCWTPNFSLIYNLSRHEVLVRERGHAAELLRIATALPGIFPPVLKEGEVFVDAGTVNFYPVDYMRERPDIETVISFDVITFEGKKKRTYDYDGRISAGEIIRNRLNPLAKRRRYVSLRDVMLPTIMIGAIKRRRETREMYDHEIRLVMSDFGMMDFSKIPELIAFGYARTSEAITEMGLEQKLAGG